LFTDIVASTTIATELGDARWHRLVSKHHAIVRRNLKLYRGREQDTAGDGFFATFPVPEDAIRSAVAAQHEVRSLGLETRAAISFGQVETVDGKPGGLVVVTAARILGLSSPGQLLVSSSIRDVLPGADIEFSDAGTHRLKGLDGDVRVFEVVAVDGLPVERTAHDDVGARRLRDSASIEGPSKTRLRVSVIACLVAALALGGWLLVRRLSVAEAPAAGPPKNALVGLDMGSGAQRRVIPIADQATAGVQRSSQHIGAVGEGGVWLVRDPYVLHVIAEQRVGGEVLVGNPSWVGGVPLTIGTGMGQLFASNGDVFTVDGADDTSRRFAAPAMGASVYGNDMAVAGGWIWVADSAGILWRIDAVDPTHIRSVHAPTGRADAVVADEGSVWTYDNGDGTVTRFDPASLEPDDPTPIQSDVAGLAMIEGDLWILSGRRVFRLGSLDEAIVGPSPSFLGAGAGFLWVGDNTGHVHRIDPLTFESDRIYRAGGAVRAVLPDIERGMVWIDVGPVAD
jgi:hypothetical protein